MTYIERITYLIGSYLEIHQYVMLNAFVYAFYLNAKNNRAISSYDYMQVIECNATEEYDKYISKSKDDYLKFFKDNNLSKRDIATLDKIITKRDEISQSFFIKHAEGLAKEDINVYNSVIKELEDAINYATDYNRKLIKKVDDLKTSL